MSDDHRKAKKPAPHAHPKTPSVEPEPLFVYDPDTDKKEFQKHQESELASELDPNAENTSDDIMLEDQKAEKKKRRRKRRKRIFVVILLLAILTLIGLAIYFFLHASKISTNPFNFAHKLKGEDEGRVNILLLGVGDPGHDGETLSDTNMVVSLDTNNNKVSMISIPRDTRVYVPGQGYYKINNANALGEQQKPPDGTGLAEKTVSQTLDIPIHYYVKANFSGLKQAVDAVGGVDIHNENLLNDPEYPCDKNESRSCGFTLKPGDYHMDGAQALKYARCRKGTCGDDFGRALRQQQVLQAIQSKALSLGTLSDPNKLNGLINAASNNIKTDMSLTEMQRAYELSKKVAKENTYNVVFSTKSNGFLKQDPTSSDLLPAAGNFDDIQAFVKNIFTLAPIWVEDPKIVIENGTATVGLAGKLQTKLENGNVPVTVLTIQNADAKDYTTSQIIDYSGGKKPNTVKYFEDLLGVKVTEGDPAKKPGSQDITIILGSDYADKTQQSTTGSSSNSKTSD